MKKVITAFKEHKEFRHNRPWDINTMYFETDIVTPPHYAETIEVLLCHDVIGEIYIGGNKYKLGGNQVFYIPPNIVHSIFYKENIGYVDVVKINISQLTPFLNISEVLQSIGQDYLSIPTKINQYDRIFEISNSLKSSQTLFEAISAIAALFDTMILSSQKASKYVLTAINSTNNKFLHKIILWSEENYLNKISIENVANLSGYTKYYFCSKFKSLTGITYLDYLNNLRIYHACNLLKDDISVEKVGELCGFENTSYFIQLFKKTIGMTPKKYIQELNSL